MEKGKSSGLYRESQQRHRREWFCKWLCVISAVGNSRLERGHSHRFLLLPKPPLTPVHMYVCNTVSLEP